MILSNYSSWCQRFFSPVGLDLFKKDVHASHHPINIV